MGDISFLLSFLSHIRLLCPLSRICFRLLFLSVSWLSCPCLSARPILRKEWGIGSIESHYFSSCVSPFVSIPLFHWYFLCFFLSLSLFSLSSQSFFVSLMHDQAQSRSSFCRVGRDYFFLGNTECGLFFPLPPRDFSFILTHQHLHQWLLGALEIRHFLPSTGATRSLRSCMGCVGVGVCCTLGVLCSIFFSFLLLTLWQKEPYNLTPLSHCLTACSWSLRTPSLFLSSSSFIPEPVLFSTSHFSSSSSSLRALYPLLWYVSVLHLVLLTKQIVSN